MISMPVGWGKFLRIFFLLLNTHVAVGSEPGKTPLFYKTDIDRRYETHNIHKNVTKAKKPVESVVEKNKRKSLVDAHDFDLDIVIPDSIG